MGGTVLRPPSSPRNLRLFASCLAAKKVFLLISEFRRWPVKGGVFASERLRHAASRGLAVKEAAPDLADRLRRVIGLDGRRGPGGSRLARQLHAQEEAIRQTFLAHTQPLLVLSSSIYVYNDRVQEYLLSQDPQAEGLTAEEFSRLTAEINSTLSISRESSARRAGVAGETSNSCSQSSRE